MSKVVRPAGRRRVSAQRRSAAWRTFASASGGNKRSTLIVVQPQPPGPPAPKSACVTPIRHQPKVEQGRQTSVAAAPAPSATAAQRMLLHIGQEQGRQTSGGARPAPSAQAARMLSTSAKAWSKAVRCRGGSRSPQRPAPSPGAVCLPQPAEQGSRCRGAAAPPTPQRHEPLSMFASASAKAWSKAAGVGVAATPRGPLAKQPSARLSASASGAAGRCQGQPQPVPHAWPPRARLRPHERE